MDQIINQELFRQACQDVRMHSDVTMTLFAVLPDVCARYASLVVASQATPVTAAEEASVEG